MCRPVHGLIIAFALFTASARFCHAQAGHPAAEAAGPRPVQAPAPTQAPPRTVASGSLLQAALASQATADPGQATLQAVSFFHVPEPEPRIMKKHDLVTIIIREESEFTSEGKTETKKDMALRASIDEMIKLNLAEMQINPGGVSEPLVVDMSGEREFNGEGTVDRSDSLIARITAEVLDVKPNGTLVLQARKHIKTDEEQQEFIVTGTCRAEDISADNTVFSTQLHDFAIAKTHTGAVRDSTKRGWVPRLLDLLNPF